MRFLFDVSFSFYIIAALWGLCLGSFINAAALRAVQGRDWVWARSRCFSCHKPLKFSQNLPLYGWLRHAGRAACCKARLPVRYIGVELLCAGLAVLVLARLGAAQAFIFTPFFVCNCVLFLTDLDDFHIPDWTSLGSLVIGLVLAASGASGLPVFAASLGGAAFGFGLLYGINFAYRLWRGHDGLGFGDVKLMAAYGAWLGAVAVLPILFLAAFAGALFGGVWLVMRRPSDAARAILPFGVFLVLAAFIWVLAQAWIAHIPLPIIPNLP